jgi:hypothetical protein
MELPVFLMVIGIATSRLGRLLLEGLFPLTILVLLGFGVHTWNTPFSSFIPQQPRIPQRPPVYSA